MPGFDNKGPQGEGPRTGRRLGRCKSARVKPSISPNTTEEESSSDFPQRGRSLRLRLGRKRGFGFGRKES